MSSRFLDLAEPGGSMARELDSGKKRPGKAGI